MIGPLSSGQWREDLHELVAALGREHRDLYHAMSRQAFRAAVRALDARIPFLAGHEIVVELARLTAMVGDGHTVLRLTDVPGFQRYPLALSQYSDGLFVRAIARDHAYAAGARLLSIGGTPAAEAYEAMRPVISRDNEMGVRAQAPGLLTIPEVLHARGVISGLGRTTYELELRGGGRVALDLDPPDQIPEDLADARERAGAPTPLWLRDSAKNWVTFLADARTVYVAYNQVRDHPIERLATFFDRVFATIAAEACDRLVLDIRANGGGNMALNRPLVHSLIRCDAVNQWSRLFAIIGCGTFSAAMNLTVDLERHTRVLFVGEPTGSSPNHYGETAEIVLPHSQLRLSASALWWQYSDPNDDRPWIAPDLPARLSSEDDAAGHDPALEAIIGYQPGSATYEEYPNRLMRQLRREDLLLPGDDPSVQPQPSASSRVTLGTSAAPSALAKASTGAH
jgi:hypothetical protein